MRLRSGDQPQFRRAIWVSAVAGLIGILVGVAATFGLYVRHDDAIDHAQTSAADEAASVAREVDLQIEGRLASLQPLAQSPAVVTSDSAGVQAALASLQLASMNVDAVAWVDAEGTTRAVAGQPPERAAGALIAKTVQTSRGPAIAVASSGPDDADGVLLVAVPTYAAGAAVNGAIVSEARLSRGNVLTVNLVGGGWDSAVVDARGDLVLADGTPVSGQPTAYASTVDRAKEAGAGAFLDAAGVNGEPGMVVGFAQVPTGKWTAFAQQDRSSAVGSATVQYRIGVPALWAVLAALVVGAGLIAWRRDVAAERRRAALGAITYGERMLRSFADGMPIMAWRTPADGRGSFVNVAYRDYFGTRAPRAVGDLPCHPDDRIRLAEMAGHLSEDGHGETELRLQREDGDLRWHLLRAESVSTPEAATICAAADIDDLRHALMVKDEFLALVSHELRTPLTVIIGNAEILRRRDAELDPSVRQELEQGISEESDNLRGLIENMLVLSQLQSGVSGAAEPQLLQRLVPVVAAAFRAEAPEAELRLVIDETVPPVDMHLVTIQQVLSNLLSNARKYGGKEVEIRVGWREGRVSAAVLDRGPGVAEEEVPRLFTPYFRSSMTEAGAPGLGLGLAVCQRLVEASGGTMYGERRAGGGMEIGFCVPPSSAWAREEAPGQRLASNG